MSSLSLRERVIYAKIPFGKSRAEGRHPRSAEDEISLRSFLFLKKRGASNKQRRGGWPDPSAAPLDSEGL